MARLRYASDDHGRRFPRRRGFSRLSGEGVREDACFEGTAFSVPQDDVCNYFLYRQNFTRRNAIRKAGNEHYSRNRLKKLKAGKIKMMLKGKEVDFDQMPLSRRIGCCLVNGKIDLDIPLFAENHAYVDRHVFCRKD